MNKRAIAVGLAYSLAVIVFKLCILLGGFTLTKFGFYYSNIMGVILILPFLFFAIYQAREKDGNGVIAGKEAMRVALTVVATAVVLVTLYHFIEFNWKF